MLDDLAPVLVVLGEEGEEARQRVGDGVEPGDEEQEADVEDLLPGELLAVDLGRVEAGEDVVLRRGEPLVEDGVEVGVELLAGVALDLLALLLLHLDRCRDG